MRKVLLSSPIDRGRNWHREVKLVAQGHILSGRIKIKTRQPSFKC